MRHWSAYVTPIFSAVKETVLEKFKLLEIKQKGIITVTLATNFLAVSMKPVSITGDKFVAGT